MKKTKLILLAIFVIAAFGGIIALQSSQKRSVICFYTAPGNVNPGSSITACKLALEYCPGGSLEEAYTKILDFVNTPDCGGITETQCETNQTIFTTVCDW
jgi:hypothetical protein